MLAESENAMPTACADPTTEELVDFLISQKGSYSIDVCWLDTVEERFDEARRIAHALRDKHDDPRVKIAAVNARVIMSLIHS